MTRVLVYRQRRGLRDRRKRATRKMSRGCHGSDTSQGVLGALEPGKGRKLLSRGRWRAGSHDLTEFVKFGIKMVTE